MNREEIKAITNKPLCYVSWFAMQGPLHGKNPTVYDDIPLINTTVFVPAIIIYISFLKLIRLILGKYRKLNLKQYDQVFILPTDRESKTQVFLEVIEEIKDLDQKILIVKDKSIQKYHFQEKKSVHSVNFRQLIVDVPTIGFSNKLRQSYYAVYDIYELQDSNRLSILDLITVYNYTFLEILKADMVANVTSECAKIHTMSPNPYTVMAHSPDDIFYYQFAKKGAFSEGDQKNSSLPFYSPVNYLVWSYKWKNLYSQQVHPDSNIFSVGSPWYEKIEKEANYNELNKDKILFLGQDGHESEELIEKLIEYCEKNDQCLRIKLHPKDDRGQWYINNGWKEYIGNYSGIVNAINSSTVVVADTSTGFIESSVLKTPAIVFDCKDWGIAKLDPCDYVYFPQSIMNGLSLIEKLIEMDAAKHSNGDKVVNTDGSCARIKKIVS